VRPVAVLGGDPRHQPGQPVRRQQQVQRARGAQRVPRTDRLADPLGIEPRGPERALRIAVDRFQHALAVALEQQLPAPHPDVLDAPQVRHQRGLARGRDRHGGGDLDLHPEALVVLPDARDPHPLALLEVRDRPDQRDVVAIPVGIDHGEAGVVAEPAPPADQDLVLERSAGRAVDHRGERSRWSGHRLHRS
jgi:hypothetical protein